MKNQPITIAGITFTFEQFPKLYQIAKNNPVGLEKTLLSLAKASGGNQDDLRMDAVNLEMDLEHG